MTVPREQGEADGGAPDLVRGGANVDDLAAAVARLTDDLTQVALDLKELTAAVLPTESELERELDRELDRDRSSPGPQQEFGGRPHGAARLVYPGVQEWVTDYFLPTFRRSFGGEVRWCTGWQQHAEAVVRLEALWRSWEALRVEPTLGMITWLTQHLDPQLAALLGRSGTFGQCTLERHADWW